MTSTLINQTGERRAMSDLELAQFRAMLEEQRDFRLEQLAELHRPDPHGPLSSADPEIFRSLADGARAALSDVQGALWRLEDGLYGSCVRCGDPLAVGRLEILPQVARCMPCQRAYSAASPTTAAVGQVS